MAKSDANSTGYHPEVTRALLVDSALRLFAEKGFDGTSMAELVKAADATKGAFYHHFSSKVEILAYISDEFADRHMSRQQYILAHFETPSEQLVQLITDLTENVAKYRNSVAIFMQEFRVLQEKHYEYIFEKRERIGACWEGVVRSGMQSGEFRADVDPVVATFGILGMVHWMYQWYDPSGRHSPRELADMFAVMALGSLQARVGDGQ